MSKKQMLELFLVEVFFPVMLTTIPLNLCLLLHLLVRNAQKSHARCEGVRKLYDYLESEFIWI